MPGSKNSFRDATSRHPVYSEEFEINSFALAVSAILATAGDQSEDIAMVNARSDIYMGKSPGSHSKRIQ